MKNTVRYLKFRVRFSFAFFLIQLVFRRKNWIFSRTACLGNDAYYQLMEEGKGDTIRFNLQKNRIDSFAISFKTRRVGFTGFRILERRDIVEIIWIQNLKFWRRLPAPRYVLMDSYSELTDQLFNFGNRNFFANYMDVKNLYLQEEKIISRGLLDMKLLSEQYNLFFDEISTLWNNGRKKFNIYFIHFPQKFESREVFKLRAQEICRIIDDLTVNYPNLISIKIPENFVRQQINKAGMLDNFPYHFDENAAKYVALEINKYEWALHGKT